MQTKRVTPSFIRLQTLAFMMLCIFLSAQYGLAQQDNFGTLEESPELETSAPPAESSPAPESIPEANSAQNDTAQVDQNTSMPSDSEENLSDSSASQSEADLELDDFYSYTKLNTQWSFGINASLNGLGNTPFISGLATTTSVRGFLLDAEYLLPFQTVGVFGFGPTLGFYTLSDQVGSTSNQFFPLWTAGGKVRYQLKFFREQWIVPTVAYHFEHFSYSFDDSTMQSGTTMLTGPSFGLWILLNVLEPVQASFLYEDTSIKRSYLVAEYKNLKSSDTAATLSGGSIYFGLRLEW